MNQSYGIKEPRMPKHLRGETRHFVREGGRHGSCGPLVRMSRAANSIARFAHRNNIKRLRVIAMFINGGRQSAIDARYLAVKSVDFS